MSLSTELRLRDATPDDLSGIAALRTAVGWGIHEWALRLVIGVPHARCVVAVGADGAIVGVGSGIVYGPLGFIGNMIVADTHRRRGIGSAVLKAVTQFLDDAGCRRLELNATSDGRPLYERHGFQSVGTSMTARIPRSAALSGDHDLSLRHATIDDLDALGAYDLAAFGGDRRVLLAMLLDDPNAPLVLAERDGAVAGYAGVRPDERRTGPLLADDPAVAETLLGEAFVLVPGVESLRLNLPPNNERGIRWLRDLGVALEPWDGRMARGAALERRDDAIYGMAVGALG